jgi:GntR family transcriptional regulator
MARFRLELGPIPLHHQVYLDLKSALDGHEWSPGDRLPTERELAGRYGCSLITVRRALGELVREGRLERTRGRGTFVLPPRFDVDFAGTLSFTEEMQTRGLLPAERFPGLLASDLEHGSLYDLLTERYGVRVAKAREALEPVLLRAREARLLGRKPGTPALLIEGVASTSDGRPVEFGRTYVRGDRTRYYVERVVVRPRWIALEEEERKHGIEVRHG